MLIIVFVHYNYSRSLIGKCNLNRGVSFYKKVKIKRLQRVRRTNILLRNQSISSNEIMVSFDVVSLFTSIPIELALQVVKQRLVQDNNLTTHTDISINNIIKLLEFVLRKSYFKYDGCHYQQISGCAMGSPISATLANIVMEHIEEIAITTAPHPPRSWFVS